ncbi:MAG: amino acid adenylation domain-containing protein, partial [Cyanobacteria bacterium P01_H01_bin.74]
GQTDLTVGSPVVEREHPDLEHQIGYFINTLALRTRFSAKDSFVDLLHNNRANSLSAFEHKNYPFDRLLQDLGYTVSNGRAPLFDVVLVLQNVELDHGGLHDMTGVAVSMRQEHLGIAKGDLRFQFIKHDGGLKVGIEYATDLFEGSRIERMAQHFTRLVDAIIEAPELPLSELSYLTAEERAAVPAFATPIQEDSFVPVCTLFDRAAASHAEADAIIYEGEATSYGTLRARSNRLAHALIDLGVAESSAVAVLLPAGTDLVSSMLATFKAGGSYMPMDEYFAEERLDQMLADTGATILIADSSTRSLAEGLAARHSSLEHIIVLPAKGDGLLDGLDLAGHGLISTEQTTAVRITDGEETSLNIDSYSDASPEVVLGAEATSYIFYTSGSTGRAKGIRGRHNSLSQYVQWHAAQWGFGSESRVAQLAAPTFDASLKDIFPALLSGGRLYIASARERENMNLLAEWLGGNKITHLQTVPSLFRLLTASLAESGTGLGALEQIVLAGEPLYGQDVLRWRMSQGTGTALANQYGLTETTVLSTYYSIDKADWEPGEVVPAGMPIGGTELAVINDGGLCRHGELGEVYISSPYLTHGYLDAARNEGVFVQNPLLSDTRHTVLRTGDLGRLREDGSLEILGRNDDQIKLHGVRVELSEVRGAVLALAGMEQTELVVHQTADHHQELVCYYTGEEADQNEIRERLEKVLNPQYIPAFFLWLDEFPLSLNGKVDRKALPKPEELLRKGDYEAPEGAIETGLAELWTLVLGVKQVGRNDSFFHVGGSSIRALQLISRIYKAYEVELTIAEIFNNPKLSEQAALIGSTDQTAYTPIAKVAEQATYTLSHAQRRSWLQEQLPNEAKPYNGLEGYQLSGKVDTQALQGAVDYVTARHEILRTVFVQQEGEPRQKIVDTGAFNVPLIIKDFTGTTLAGNEDALKTVGESFRQQAFDLATGPMWRVMLAQYGNDESVFLISMHHIVSDEWSMQVLMREMVQAYNSLVSGKQPELPALPI